MKNKVIAIYLDVAFKEWQQTFDEAKIYFEGEKEIIKQTILVSISTTLGILYFLTSDKVVLEELIKYSFIFIFIPFIYLCLSIYSFYQTYYRFMISKYWTEELFPKIENLLKELSEEQWQKYESLFLSDLKFLRYQIHYRENLNIFYLIAIFLYRAIPLFFGTIVTITYIIFLFKTKNLADSSLIISYTKQNCILILFLISFVILFFILIYFIFKIISVRLKVEQT